VTVPVLKASETELFTITLKEVGEEVHLKLTWDTTSVIVPFSVN
jgi:hypothetical protein